MRNYYDLFKNVGLQCQFSKITDFSGASVDSLTVEEVESLKVDGYKLMRGSYAFPAGSNIRRVLRTAGANRFYLKPNLWRDIKDKELIGLIPYLSKAGGVKEGYVTLVVHSLARSGINYLSQINDMDTDNLVKVRGLSEKSFYLITECFNGLPKTFTDNYAVMCGVTYKDNISSCNVL